MISLRTRYDNIISCHLKPILWLASLQAAHKYVASLTGYQTFLTNVTNQPKSRTRYRNRTALVLAGDVETNPGPHINSKLLKLFHININGIRHKLDEIESEFEDYDIIAVTETKLDDNISTNEITLADFQEPFRKDRTENNGGGIICLLKNHIAARRMPEYELNSGIESLCLEILNQPFPTIFCAIYNPPNHSNEKWTRLRENFEKMLDHNQLSKVIIMGDINDDLLIKNPVPKMTQILHELNLSQHIISPTRITNNSTTLIDHAISNIPEHIDSAGPLPCLVSDHHAIYLHINWSQSLLKRQIVEVWDYRHGNYEALNARFRDLD